MISVSCPAVMRLFGAAALAVLGGALLSLFTGADGGGAHEPRSVSMRTAPAASLATAGVRLSAPDATPLIDRDAAIAAAERVSAGAAIREAIFAQVDDGHAQNASVHCVCWIVSIMPPGGLTYPSNGPFGRQITPAPPTYEIEIIDGATGDFIEGLIRS